MARKIRDDRLLWIDIETSDSDENAPHAALLEIGLTITSSSGQKWLDSETSFLLEPNDRQLELLYQWPQEVMLMHTKNGLLFDWLKYEDPYESLYERILQWVNSHIDGPPLADDERITAAGSGLHFDRRWLTKFVPQLDRHLTYYNIDVGVMRRMIEMHGGHIAHSEQEKQHRAITCNRGAIDTYRRVISILHDAQNHARERQGSVTHELIESYANPFPIYGTPVGEPTPIGQPEPPGGARVYLARVIEAWDTAGTPNARSLNALAGEVEEARQYLIEADHNE